ncbi:MAG: hypothetical protein J6V72_10865, partial [Kiritimatiellae bacterium]|nr:hypothetical protein [Kiritimatiellia bacterium]
KRVLQMSLQALAVLVGVLADARPVTPGGSPRSHGEMSSRLSRHGSFGRINIQGGKKHFPEGAEVSIERKRPDDVKHKIHQGWSKRKGSDPKRGPAGRSGVSPLQTPNVLASYDISIRHGGRKWQPDAGDPVRVAVELDEPVACATGTDLGVVHLADDGTVEALPASRYGFTYNAARTAVTAFWFDASGFSIYSIVNNSGTLVTPRRFYHFYDRPVAVPGSTTDEVQALPYRYTDRSNEVINVQIVKDGDSLVEPPIPPDIVDVNSNLVSSFEGWYVVQTNAHTTMHGLDVAEAKLDSTSVPFVFVWPVGVTGQRLAFTNAISFAEAETGDTDYWVVPLYEHSRFVQFYESAEEDMQNVENVHIVGRRLVALNDETHSMQIRVSDVTAPLRNSRGEYFSGWEYHRTASGPKTQIMTYSAQGVAQEAFLEVDDALFEVNRTAENGGHVVPMWPVYVEAHFLSFSPALPKGSGATYVGSLFVKSDTDIRSVEVSARPGYEFGGWWTGTNNGDDKVPDITYGQQVTDANGVMTANLSSLTNHLGETIASTDANGRIALNADVTLYAKWIPQPNATYRVIIWQQKVTDDKDAAAGDKTYDYVTHYTSERIRSDQSVTEAMLRSFSGTNSLKSRVSGLNVLSASALANRAEVTATGMSFTGFEADAHWAVTNTEANGCVKSDNSTIVNVYFDRKLITLTFESTYSFTKTGNANTTGTFYGEEDGANYFQVYYNAQDGKWYRSLSYEEYTGAHYYWTGTRWRTDRGTSYTPQYTDQDRTTELYASGNKWYLPSYSDEYTGDRYIATSGSSTTFTVMTGLYGQTLAKYGYTWPSMLVWKEDANTTLTFLDAFMPATEGDMTYSSTQLSADSGNTKAVSFFKQKLDGTYDDANPDNSVMTAGSQFTVTEKYNGFTASQYRTNGGNWNNTSVNSKISSGYNTLDIRFARNEYEFIFRDSDTGENVFTTNLLYEASFAGLYLSPTNALIDWHGRDREHYTFEGWFEDASGTTEFDFANGRMGTATKVVFAVWKPVQYKVIIDPNGGQLEGDDSTWFWVDYNETVKEYTPTRDYRLDMDGEFYYSYHPYDPLGDKHVTPTTSPEFIPNISRRAYYTDDVAEATDTFNRYAYERGAYRFMGWYEVLPDGTVDSAPFAFGTRHNRELVIRAIWQRSGLYTLKYESIDPAGEQATEVWFDPDNGRGGYIDEGVTTLSKDPTNYDRDEYVWEGWQVIDPRQGNLPLTNIRSPGDVYIVHASHADSDNIIHMRAVYSRRADGSSRHIPKVVDLILDSNADAGLSPTAASVVTAVPGRVGTYTEDAGGVFEGMNQGVWFAGQQNNFSVNLADYTAAFSHANGYLLLGWSPYRNAGDGEKMYFANETIGVDMSTAAENVLYAVWEPQIYIDITNATDTALSGITLYIPGWVDGKVYQVASPADTYHRTEFTAFQDGSATISLPAGGHICLVIPDGNHKDFTVSGTSPFTEGTTTGTKLIVTRTTPEVEGEAPSPDSVNVAYPGGRYFVSGTMYVNPTPVKVRFDKATYQTSTTVPVRYFLHDPDGTVTEITGVAADWKSLPLSSFTVNATTNDIAKTLRMDASRGVHYYLADEIEQLYGHTTIGIGAATGTFNEYRTITKGEPEGGSYLRFFDEKLLWSRYGVVWNEYVDSAVYVVFYKRIPVHVTIAKEMTGTEEDKDRGFTFTAEITPRSKTLEYTVTKTWRKTRTATQQGHSIIVYTWWDDWEEGTWGPYTEYGSVVTNMVLTPIAEDQNLFDARPSETFALKDMERHPLTTYFASHENGTASDTSPENYVEGAYEQNGLTRTRIDTMTYTQTETFRVHYQYETVKITEAAVENYLLSSIGSDSNDPLANHNGTANVAERSYTFSSIRGPDSNGFYDYQPLDTAVFRNARKTGTVTVSKSVVNGEPGEKFRFTVTLGETVVGKDGYTAPSGVNLGPYGKVFSFELGNGGSVTLPGLPAGASYAVEEVANPLFVTSVAGNNASGTIAPGTATVAFTNTRKADVSIVMNCRTNYFNGAEQVGSEIHSVTGGAETVVSTADYTVTGLNAGHVLTVAHHVPARGTAVGEYAGNFVNAVYAVHDATDADVTGNYLFTSTPATLTIIPTPIVVTITGNRDTVVYNGEEQRVEGYTYEIVRKTDGTHVDESEVHPVIEPAYSKAKGTDAGTYWMSLLDSSAVSFVMGDGFVIAPEDIHVSNGQLTITPAPATVTADDKSKIPGLADPTLTATATGLFGSDTVSYSVTRAAGEAVGTYAITVSGATDQGNYTVTYAPGTFTIRPLTLIQRATGEGLQVTDPVSSSLLASLGIANQDDATPEVVDGYLNQMDPNGLRRWENLRTGTEPTQLLLSTSAAAGTSQLAAQMVADPGSVIDLGYTMLRELRKEQDGSWVRVAGPAVAGNPSFPIELEDEGGNSVGASGLYRVVTLLVPNQNQAITNEIPSTNIIGVLEVNSAVSNAITVVPWKQLASDPAAARDVTVSNFVAALNLSAGDEVYTLDADQRGYKMWNRKTDGIWEPVTTVRAADDGSSLTVQAESADVARLPRGSAVWVKRVDTTKPYFLGGQYDEGEVTVQ